MEEVMPDPITTSVIVAAGLLAINVALYLWGRAAQGTGTTVTLVGNIPTADCAAACKQFDDRRVELCMAKVAEAAAKSELDARRTDYYGALTTLLALLAAV